MKLGVVGNGRTATENKRNRQTHQAWGERPIGGIEAAVKAGEEEKTEGGEELAYSWGATHEQRQITWTTTRCVYSPYDAYPLGRYFEDCFENVSPVGNSTSKSVRLAAVLVTWRWSSTS